MTTNDWLYARLLRGFFVARTQEAHSDRARGGYRIDGDPSQGYVRERAVASAARALSIFTRTLRRKRS
jgi:hypothetical protein